VAKKKRTDSDGLIPTTEGAASMDVAPPVGGELLAVPEEEFVGPPAPVPAAPLTEEAQVGPPLPEPPRMLVEDGPPARAPMPAFHTPDIEPTVLTPPPTAVVAQPPPVAHLAFLSGSEVEERLRRLEQTLADIKEIEQRLAARASGDPPHNAPPEKSEASSLLSGAASLLEVGRLLLPSALVGPGKPPTPGSLADLLADLRAMYWMMVDPRYGMTWLGRLGIPGFLIAFLFPWGWLPFNTVLTAWVAPLGWLYLALGQLVAGFGLFRVTTSEARRYRETAPDLPPSLRI
jgi:hypothetical protein